MSSPSSFDYRVTTLPRLTNSNSTQYAGSIPIHDQQSSSKEKSLFFWYFPAKEKPSSPPTPESRLLFWFAGGPGCSSLTEPFSGNGPLVLTENGNVAENDAWSWNELADVVYVDSPYGTGYSRSLGGVDVTDEEEVAEDFLKFLFKFLDVFPELRKSSVYLAGRGYSGVSVPYMARSILGHNRGVSSSDQKIQLQAIALNNGFVSPKFHYGSVRRYLQAHDDLMSLLSDEIQRRLKAKHRMLMHHYYEAQPEPIPFHHWDEYKTYLLERLREVTAPCFDWHDVSKVRGPEDCETDDFDKGEALAKYLNDDATRIALNVPDMTPEWETCRTNEVLVHDTSLPSYMLFKELLQDIRIVMYNGDHDMEANYVGTEEFLKSIAWGGRITPGWENPTLVGWGKIEGTEEDEFLAYGRSERRLTYLRVLNSGYEVSESKPEVAYRLLKDVVFDKKGSTALEPPPGSTDHFSASDLTNQQSLLSTTTTMTTVTLATIFLIFFSLAGIFLCVQYRRLHPANSIRDRTQELDSATRSGGLAGYETKPRRRQGARGKYSPVDSQHRNESGESSGNESDESGDA